MTAWETETLENCLEALLDYRGKSPTKSPWGIPVLSARVVKTAGLLRPIEQTVAPDYYPKWMTRGYPKPGDVVMTTEAPLGEVIQLDEETASYGLGQRLVCLRGKAGILDNTFLRYLLTSPVQQEVLASRATGTTVLGISQKALRSMPIAFPEFSEQQRIGELLASLDDKIELNRKMSATLEAIARALFRDWFVDFGPTRAKMAGTAPYLSPDLWSLLAGVNLREAPRRIGDHPHCLLRLHGEADTAIGRVLTREEYEANYGVEGSYREILRATINATSLLFLGCSLNVDRTIASLAELKGQARVATPRHYAFLPLTEGMDREARRAELGAADIHPIWYPPENHDQSIEDLLISLIEGGFHE